MWKTSKKLSVPPLLNKIFQGRPDIGEFANIAKFANIAAISLFLAIILQVPISPKVQISPKDPISPKFRERLRFLSQITLSVMIDVIFQDEIISLKLFLSPNHRKCQYSRKYQISLIFGKKLSPILDLRL